MAYTPSTCPLPSWHTKGAANIRSSLVAFRARVYSLALSNGCSAGSRLRCWRCTFEPGACWDEAARVRALIFYSSHQNLPSSVWPRMRRTILTLVCASRKRPEGRILSRTAVTSGNTGASNGSGWDGAAKPRACVYRLPDAEPCC